MPTSAADAVDRATTAIAATALTTDTSFLTAHANDCGFEGVLERHVEALGRHRDVLMAISTSGGSIEHVMCHAIERELFPD